jgi:hypothetical protein
MEKTRQNQEDDSIKPIGFTGVREKLSALWIFAVFNYLYADVIGLMKAETLQELITGYAGSMQITEGFLLSAAVLMETAIAMVLLSRVLRYRANRWANIIVGLLHSVSVSASMFVGSGPGLYYLFFGTIEVACTAYIVWYAWRWPKTETSDNLLQVRRSLAQ